MVDVGYAAHDEERGWVDVNLGLARLNEMRVTNRNGRTTQRMQSFQHRGSDPIRLHTMVSTFNDGIGGMKRRTRFHIHVFPLLSEQVKPEKKYADEQADGGSRPNQRGANEVVLGLIITPTAHAKSEVLERPIEWRGSQNIELVWVRNQSVVRRPHGDIEVPEVPEER